MMSKVACLLLMAALTILDSITAKTVSFLFIGDSLAFAGGAFGGGQQGFVALFRAALQQQQGKAAVYTTGVKPSASTRELGDETFLRLLASEHKEDSLEFVIIMTGNDDAAAADAKYTEHEYEQALEILVSRAVSLFPSAQIVLSSPRHADDQEVLEAYASITHRIALEFDCLYLDLRSVFAKVIEAQEVHSVNGDSDKYTMAHQNAFSFPKDGHALLKAKGHAVVAIALLAFFDYNTQAPPLNSFDLGHLLDLHHSIKTWTVDFKKRYISRKEERKRQFDNTLQTPQTLPQHNDEL